MPKREPNPSVSPASGAARDLSAINQIAPRLSSIVLSGSSFFALMASILATGGIVLLPVRSTPIADIAGVGLTYASVSLAACLSGLVLSLALPGEQRLRRWARMKSARSGKSLLSDLVFTFFWASCCQLGVLLVCFAAILFGGPLLVGEPQPLPVSHVTALFAGLFVGFYSVAQLYVVLQTLVQVGVLVILEEQQD
ncbi:hypothetical protein [Microbacterium sp. LMI1x-1-1.1]|uniref:hypothetical protein n=1 Tax=Microbacterium sp. LMI1x-1-1.1 TaxID=3135246 RepID=UPI00342E200C